MNVDNHQNDDFIYIAYLSTEPNLINLVMLMSYGAGIDFVFRGSMLVSFILASRHKGFLMKKQVLVGLSSLFLVLLFLSVASATSFTTTFEVADDRTIGDNNTDGTPDSLASQTDGYLRTGFFTGYWRSALEFDISPIASDSFVIDSATLYLTDQGSSRSGEMNLWGYSGNGVIELNDALQTSYLIDTFTIDAAAGVQTFAIDVLDFLENLTLSQPLFAGFLVGSATPTGFGGAASDIVSSDISTYSFDYNLRPHLVVNYDIAPVPEPSTMFLLGTALGGLAIYQRRSSK